MGLCIPNKVHQNTEIICSVATDTDCSQINKNEHVKYCLSFNDVSERHVRLWPNKCMTFIIFFWYVKCAQRVKLLLSDRVE